MTTLKIRFAHTGSKEGYDEEFIEATVGEDGALTVSGKAKSDCCGCCAGDDFEKFSFDILKRDFKELLVFLQANKP